MKLLVNAVLRSLNDKSIAPKAAHFVTAGKVLTVKPKKRTVRK